MLSHGGTRPRGFFDELFSRPRTRPECELWQTLTSFYCWRQIGCAASSIWDSSAARAPPSLWSLSETSSWQISFCLIPPLLVLRAGTSEYDLSQPETSPFCHARLIAHSILLYTTSSHNLSYLKSWRHSEYPWSLQNGYDLSWSSHRDTIVLLLH